jgi:hypothetical protein
MSIVGNLAPKPLSDKSHHITLYVIPNIIPSFISAKTKTADGILEIQCARQKSPRELENAAK